MAPPAITHADLAPKPRGVNLASKTGVILTVACIVCGLLCFVLSLFAEATRSEVKWVVANDHNGKGGHEEKGEYECIYSGSGKISLICAAAAFVTLGITMLVQHSFILIALGKTAPPMLVTWDPESYRPIESLSWQAGCFFISTWLCFAVGEVMLLVGLSVESGHLKEWSKPRPSCLIIRAGVFTSAGVFSILTVFLAAGLYATLLRVQWLCQHQQNVQREALDVSTLYASPPRSPRPHHPTAQSRSSDASGQNMTLQWSSWYQYLSGSALSHKQGGLV
uniref:Transmembrane protein n=1 Tax=Opuntia streptacantha TaxID=393608 RepID=A0A7C9E601_OPUST